MEKRKWLEKDIENLPKKQRLHLINSCTGYKSANLIGTISAKGEENLAIFSSVIHLGSDPALLGFILRPTTVPRHSFSNILESKFFTVNSVSETFYQNAHRTSLKFPKEISEFIQASLTPEYKENFKAPYVLESPLQLGCQYLSHYKIKENGTLLVVAKIESIYADPNLVESDLFLNLSKGKITTLNGLDGYVHTQLMDRIPYEKEVKIKKLY